MNKILIVFGTRPEAIKMAPLVKALKDNGSFEAKVCVTAQHRELLDQILHFFEIRPDYDLNLMRDNQRLSGLSANVIEGMSTILNEFKPDLVLVHGDTTTSTFAALAAYYAQIPVGHVEAGLRTYDRYAPFPEEINRQLTARIASLHFAPTKMAGANLLNEHIDGEHIFITGNTVIDALYWAKDKLNDYHDDEINFLKSKLSPEKRLIVVTAHRRENFGQGIIDICFALKYLAETEDVEIVFPVHPNPNVQKPINELLGQLKNVRLVKPLGYPAFTWLMLRAYMVITDSGGVQEEAPGLGKPVLVMRKVSERPEAIIAGTVKLVGTDTQKIIQEASLLLHDKHAYKAMSTSENPYGDGKSAERIVEILKNHLFQF
ncbi:non-hydrolyzing UDP-N-acetylglucosamine 2-epimerase [Parapedobacter tibetensis]|uniref:non-hydrolyzing UDP-N-acetylglucosamine 2-epimerase n=1 Tax=Parapedobacter tibetensis TaxID=2972951 RepID=UPI00214DB446|nr:UDP-N-acetylglucosamine 2-epimerase (non-hydrolyzing) [Parapedobacter tibetensis]